MKQTLLIIISLLSSFLLALPWDITLGPVNELPTVENMRDVCSTPVTDTRYFSVFSCVQDGSEVLAAHMLEVDPVSGTAVTLNTIPCVIDAQGGYASDVVVLDNAHFLVTWHTDCGEGICAIIIVHPTTNTMEVAYSLSFDQGAVDGDFYVLESYPSFKQILFTYRNGAGALTACYLKVLQTEWTIEATDAVELDVAAINDPAVRQMYGEYFFCSYSADDQATGKAAILQLDVQNQTIALVGASVFETQGCKDPTLLQRGPSGYACIYANNANEGKIAVLGPDYIQAVVHTIGIQPFGDCALWHPSVTELPESHYICTWSSMDEFGMQSEEVMVFSIDPITCIAVEKNRVSLEQGTTRYSDLIVVDEGDLFLSYALQSPNGMIGRCVTIGVEFEQPVPGMVYGTVVCGVTGNPIPGVQVLSGEEVLAETNEYGAYVVYHAPGEFGIFFTHPEYYCPGAMMINLEPNGYIECDMLMTPGALPVLGAAQGDVYYNSGDDLEILEDVQVYINGQLRGISTSYGYLVDYEIGHRTLQFKKEGFEDLFCDVVLVPDQIFALDVEMFRDTTFTGVIEGKVICMDGAQATPVIGAEIWLDTQLLAVSNDRGNYTFELHHGDYQIRIEAEGYIPLQETITVIEDEVVDHDIVIEQQTSTPLLFIPG